MSATTYDYIEDPEVFETRNPYDFWMDVADKCEELHDWLLGQSRVGVVEACAVDGLVSCQDFATETLARCWITVQREQEANRYCEYFIVGADIK